MADLRALLAGLFGLCALVFAEPAAAHSLGVDRAELVELEPGQYRLVSQVPRRIQPAIYPPVLPERCVPQGNPGGERGAYSVTFTFTCDTPLTADDALLLPWERDGALLTARWRNAEPVTRLAGRDGGAIVVPLADWLAGSGSILRAAERYTILGIEHILVGIDHLLFVLALLFVVSDRWKLVKTITAFTIAHSVTLGLATLGYITLAPAPVEAAIALSIVFLASEIVRHRDGRPSLTFQKPWLVAFAFGLLHGLGFAGALSEIGLPPSEVPVALLFFNIGVEIGQLAFVAAILIVTWCLKWLAPRDRLVSAVRLTTIYGIGTAAMVWFIERAGQVFLTS